MSEEDISEEKTYSRSQYDELLELAEYKRKVTSLGYIRFVTKGLLVFHFIIVGSYLTASYLDNWETLDKLLPVIIVVLCLGTFPMFGIYREAKRALK